jgi:hypothetical protein
MSGKKIMTTLMAVEIVMLLVLGGFVVEARMKAMPVVDDREALQQRLNTVQKCLDETQKRLAAAEDSLDGCQQDLVDQGITANARLLDCQKATAENIRRHCGSLCAKCYVLVRDVEEDLTGILDKRWRVSAEVQP